MLLRGYLQQGAKLEGTSVSISESASCTEAVGSSRRHSQAGYMAQALHSSIVAAAGAAQHTLSGKTLAPRSRSGTLKRRVLPWSWILTTISVSSVTGTLVVAMMLRLTATVRQERSRQRGAQGCFSQVSAAHTKRLQRRGRPGDGRCETVMRGGDGGRWWMS